MSIELGIPTSALILTHDRSHPMTDRETLLHLLRKHSVQFGEFTLASGRKSNVYVDARLTMLRAQAQPLIGGSILERFRSRGWDPDAVGGLTMGADPIVSAVVRESLDWKHPIDGFLIRKEPKGHGRQQYVEGFRDGDGLTAVILEDTCTTGGSAVKAIERAKAFGFEVIGACCLVDREEGGKEAVEETGVPFERVFTLKELIGKG